VTAAATPSAASAEELRREVASHEARKAELTERLTEL
jgi:hypothetical protein